MRDYLPSRTAPSRSPTRAGCGSYRSLGRRNDRNDAKVSGDLLRTNYLPLAHMRDEETREKLFVVNDRVTYGLMRGQLRGTMRWLLKRRDVEVDAPFSDEGRRKLKELRLREMRSGWMSSSWSSRR